MCDTKWRILTYPYIYAGTLMYKIENKREEAFINSTHRETGTFKRRIMSTLTSHCHNL